MQRKLVIVQDQDTHTHTPTHTRPLETLEFVSVHSVKTCAPPARGSLGNDLL